jgi:hypothetical protein
MPRPVLFVILAALPACGHISNGVIEADAAFLSALPDGESQSPVGPDTTAAAETTVGDASLLTPRPFDGLDPRGTSSEQRSTATTTAWLDEPLDQEGWGDPFAPPHGGTNERPDWTTPTHDEHGHVVVVDPSLPRFAPMAQSAEMLTGVGLLLETVFEASDRLRESAPSTSTAAGRTWDDLAWSGDLLDGDIQSTGTDQYAWTLASGEGVPFVTGTVDARPTATTGSGAWAFDGDAYAAAFGVAAGGRVALTFDNRVGVELDLGLDGVRFRDGSGTCDGTSALANPFGVRPGWVASGPRQSYTLTDNVGDYQFVTLREHVCEQPAESRIRLRWTAEGGRADATVRLGDGEHWTWTQCWVGAFDPDHPAYEKLQTWTADGETSTPRDGGDDAACIYADFASVDEDVLAG